MFGKLGLVVALVAAVEAHVDTKFLRRSHKAHQPFGGFSGHHFGGHHSGFGSGMTFNTHSFGARDPAMSQVADILKGILGRLVKQKHKAGQWTEIAQEVVHDVQPTFPKDVPDFNGKLSNSLNGIYKKLGTDEPSFFMNAVAADYPNMDMKVAKGKVRQALAAVMTVLKPAKK